MDSFELNKIAGAILVTALTVTVIGHVGDMLIPTDAAEHGAEQVASAAAGAGAARPERTVEPLSVRLAAASAEEGETLARRCVACHTFEQGGANKVGPNLYDVIGRPPGTVSGYNYSSGFADFGDSWGYPVLDEFLANPRDVVSGTKMSFRLANPQDRAHMIAYLKSISPGAPEFPEPEEVPEEEVDEEATPEDERAEGESEGEAAAPDADAEQQAAADATGDPMEAVFADASAEDGESVARRCVACHSFEEGGPNKVGPNLFGVVGRERGTVEGFNYSEGLAAMGGEWDYASLFEYLENPRDYVERSKMVFRLADEQLRADVIAYLKSISPGAPPLPGRSE